MALQCQYEDRIETHLPSVFLPLWLEHPLAKEGAEPGACNHLHKSFTPKILSLLIESLTGALAQAPPVAAISMAGGGVERAAPAPASPRLDSKVRSAPKLESKLRSAPRLESKVRQPR